MTFKELQDEVIALRFNENERTRVKRWINARYQRIWNAADWTFKRVPAANLTVTAGDSTPTMPADFARAFNLYTNLGDELPFVDPDVWEELTLPSATGGVPSIYTVIDRQVYLSPTPTSNATYKLSYMRRLAHVDATLGVVGGIMSDDTDQPIWSAEHDYVLVLEAVMLGQQLRNDPTWTLLVQSRDEALEAMKQDLVLNVDWALRQWGD